MTNFIFVDTSAFYALMDRSDDFHDQARESWEPIVEEEMLLATSNYVIVETCALLQNRLGFDAANKWERDILGIVDVIWIKEAEHRRACELWLGIGRRRLSLVDCSSFVAMRERDIEIVFGFDKHFEEQGFDFFWRNKKSNA